MNNKTAYWLIMIGIVLLAWNTGYINFSILLQPLSVPIALIIVGLIDLILHYLDFGDFGKVIKSITNIMLIIIIIFNFGAFITRLVTPTSFIDWRNYDNAFFNAENNSISFGFTQLNLTSYSNSLIAKYYNMNNELVNQTVLIENNESYNISNSFGNAHLDLTNMGENNILSLDNSFGSVTLNNINRFNKIIIDSSFANTIITTEVTGEMQLIISNSFGSLSLILPEGIDYLIETSNSFGSLNNNIGLESSNYENATNKIHIIISNSFGSLTLNTI
jgi:hypothetical protein